MNKLYKGISDRHEHGKSGYFSTFHEFCFSFKAEFTSIAIKDEIFEVMPHLLPKVFFYNKKHNVTIYILDENADDHNYILKNYLLFAFNYNQYWAELN